MKKIDKTSADKGNVTRSADSLGPNSEIGRKLKQYYDDLVSEGVPDRFSQLLAELEKVESSPKKD